MTLSRRDFLLSLGLGATASTLQGVVACGKSTADGQGAEKGSDEWESIRARFALSPDHIHLAGLLIASNPDPVRKTIEEHRKALNENPAVYVLDNNAELQRKVRRAAARYMGVESDDIALTDSTTMGLALVYNGVKIREDQEMLTTDHDYYSTHASLRYKAARSGASVREIPLYQGVEPVSESRIVERLIAEVRPNTRVIALTWVHSSTGLKFPIRGVADALVEINRNRNEDDRALLFVDGVHGLGVEDIDISALGCDFFIAGTHKWMFGPRGTGIVWGAPQSQAAVSPTIPTFSHGEGWGETMSPGGYKPFEHLWALTQAFEFHREIGRAHVTNRIHSLNRKFKEGMAGMAHVKLHTPMEENLSAGTICFEVDGMSPEQVVDRLMERNIVASTTPYSPSYARIAPGLINSMSEVEPVLQALQKLGS
ncbi:aminotransferase class V-fold PLP-dependent enzyme [Microbulbifer sp.]|uniref:aminotransferase class V-fold PLP-dependent enzyme n=1 Tax=Microbulbifer sp. TaxID=1908541 RepID=UPI003F2CAFC0